VWVANSARYEFHKIEILNANERSVASAVVGWWDTFAATGSPGAVWPLYDTTDRQSLKINLTSTVESHLLEEICNFWSTIRVVPGIPGSDTVAP
jgi:carboxylesterase type B